MPSKLPVNDGAIAAGLDHYAWRAGDPHLDRHVVISNTVQTVDDGKWRSLVGVAGPMP